MNPIALATLLLTITAGAVKGAPEGPSTMSPALEELCNAMNSSTVPSEYPKEAVECAEKVGLAMESFEKLNFSSPDTDDKCFVKCMLVRLGYVSDAGEPLTDVVTAGIKSHFPPEHHELAITTFNDCIIKADNATESAGGRTKAPCQFSLALSACLDVEEVKFCKKLRTEASG